MEVPIHALASEVAQHWDMDLQGPQCTLLLRSSRRSMGRRQMCGAQVWWHICCYAHACPGRETSPSPPQISTSPWAMARASIERCSWIWHQTVHIPRLLTVQNPESEVSAKLSMSIHCPEAHLGASTQKDCSLSNMCNRFHQLRKQSALFLK